MSKSVEFPTAQRLPTAKTDQWVGGKTETRKNGNTEKQKSGVKLARLTIDVPDELHGMFKAACAKNRTKMRDEVLAFIEKWTQEHS